MATLIQSYEQQYSVITAEVTAKIGLLKAANADVRDQLSKEIQINFEEANDLLEQLELESRGTGGGGSRVAAYRAELRRVRADFREAFDDSGSHNIDLEEYEDWPSANEQRQKLLDNTERLERTGKNVTEGYRVILETEQVGAAVLQDLSSQRETIQRSRNRVRETDEQLERGARLLRGLLARALQRRLLLALVLAALVALLALALYWAA